MWRHGSRANGGGGERRSTDAQRILLLRTARTTPLRWLVCAVRPPAAARFLHPLPGAAWLVAGRDTPARNNIPALLIGDIMRVLSGLALFALVPALLIVIALSASGAL